MAGFSDFTRIIGRGPTLSRPLTREEARDAMSMVLDGKADPVALGGFLLVLRQRGETAEELAGFVDAVKARAGVPQHRTPPDIDWPSYADKHRQQPWFVLAALLLAKNNIRVLMHGIGGETVDCAPTRPVLAELGIAPARSLTAAADQMDAAGFAYIGLEDFAAETEKLFHLKPKLGVRSVANTFARDLNPLGAAVTMIGIVHSPYRPLHIEALRLLGQDKAAVFKGVGGEAQRNPYKAGKVATLTGGQELEEEWPSVLGGDPFLWREEDLSPARVAALWRGEIEHPAAEVSIVATAALALKTMGGIETQDQALTAADAMWQRHKSEVAAA